MTRTIMLLLAIGSWLAFRQTHARHRQDQQLGAEDARLVVEELTSARASDGRPVAALTVASR